MLPVGVPDLLQEGDGFGAADGAQADRPAGGWREEASEDEAEEGVRPSLLFAEGLAASWMAASYMLPALAFCVA